ncbi:MAG: type II toxin-antitoxin system VapC family toxin [Planctomycetes bacterium]|nr:type II toxin-antitoxin system VapC family toxin [Planctomycetota bacterium]
MLFDTDVLIWFLRGDEKAAALLARERDRAMSLVSLMELVQGARDKREQAVTRAFLARMDFRILPLTETIGHRALHYLEQHSLKNGIKMPDALVGATAVEYKQPLVTANIKHYRVLTGVDIVPFKP